MIFLYSLTCCGGVMTASEGSFSSPNHPGSYPPNLLCVWVIRTLPPYVIQIHVSSLTVEGPSPCLNPSRLLVHPSPFCRFCGNVAPPTLNTNSSTAWVTFRSDGSIAGTGFAAKYRAILPEQSQCPAGSSTFPDRASLCKQEFMCDSGRCLLPASVCDGHPNCHDRADEANCSNRHKGESVPLDHKSLKKKGSELCLVGLDDPPPNVKVPRIEQGLHLLVFVADEGVADIGFNATYQAVFILDSELFSL
uniref:Membrane frizzled-related protein n=1 Tax=Oryzias latipes TaxID=8090 RepID=A0A3P9LW46_ORYLA